MPESRKALDSEPEFSATRPLAAGAVRTPPPPVAPEPVMELAMPSVPEPYTVTRLQWVAGKPLSGRYVMVEKLGEGGMGTVYLAEDLLLRRRVAVKTLFDEDSFEPGDVERFRKEVSLAHAISHPNVARTYDFGEAGGVHYITMEHLKGETLMARIRRGPVLKSKELREIAVPLCRGLRAAHAVGVIHRDLKPANIMLVPDDRKVVVMDFGIARSIADARGDDLSRTRKVPDGQDAPSMTPWDVTSAGLGTPAYMAPEQWDQLSGDQRTDIYALGVILYVCLTGQAPYAADTPTLLGVQHKQASVPDVGSLAKEVDADLAALIRDCLAKDPAARPQSMDEVLDRLERGQRRRTYTLQLAASVLATAVVLFLVGFAVYSLAERAILREMRPALSRLAELIARDISPADLDAVRKPEDITKAEFLKVRGVLDRYREKNPETHFFYTMRPGETGGLYHYVVDGEPLGRDANGDGMVVRNEGGSPPSTFYDGSHLPAMAAVVREGKPQTDGSFAQDGLDVTISGYAPVLRDGKPSQYFVGVDVTNHQLTGLRWNLWMILGATFLAIIASLAYVLAPRRQQRRERAALARAVPPTPN